MNIWKIIYLNCGEIYEDKTVHRSYTHNLSSGEIKARDPLSAVPFCIAVDSVSTGIQENYGYSKMNVGFDLYEYIYVTKECQ